MHRLKDVVVGDLAADPDAQDSVEESNRIEQEARLQSLRTANSSWKPEEFAPFAATQALPADVPLPLPRLGEDDALIEELDTDAEASSAAAPAPERAASAADKPLTPKEVRSTDHGYGTAGKSVQQTLHAKHLTDRYIMKQTLLEGKPRIGSREVCSRLRSGNAGGKKALPREAWLQVMRAALIQCPIARLDEAVEGKPAVVIKPIPSEEASKIRYHNALMTLCGMTLRELSDAMLKASNKKKGASRSRSRSPVR